MANKDFGSGVIIEKGGKYLVIKESINNKEIGKEVDMLAFPMGHLNTDETVSEGVIREVLEETGYKVKVTSIVGIYDFFLASGIVFKGELVDETTSDFDKSEIKEIKWMTAEEIMKSKTRPAVKESLKDLLDSKNYSLDLISTIRLG